MYRDINQINNEFMAEAKKFLDSIINDMIRNGYIDNQVGGLIYQQANNNLSYIIEEVKRIYKGQDITRKMLFDELNKWINGFIQSVKQQIAQARNQNNGFGGGFNQQPSGWGSQNSFSFGGNQNQGFNNFNPNPGFNNFNPNQGFGNQGFNNFNQNQGFNNFNPNQGFNGFNQNPNINYNNMFNNAPQNNPSFNPNFPNRPNNWREPVPNNYKMGNFGNNQSTGNLNVNKRDIYATPNQKETEEYSKSIQTNVNNAINNMFGNTPQNNVNTSVPTGVPMNDPIGSKARKNEEDNTIEETLELLGERYNLPDKISRTTKDVILSNVSNTSDIEYYKEYDKSETVCSNTIIKDAITEDMAIEIRDKANERGITETDNYYDDISYNAVEKMDIPASTMKSIKVKMEKVFDVTSGIVTPENTIERIKLFMVGLNELDVSIESREALYKKFREIVNPNLKTLTEHDYEVESPVDILEIYNKESDIPSIVKNNRNMKFRNAVADIVKEFFLYMHNIRPLNPKQHLELILMAKADNCILDNGKTMFDYVAMLSVENKTENRTKIIDEVAKLIGNTKTYYVVPKSVSVTNINPIKKELIFLDEVSSPVEYYSYIYRNELESKINGRIVTNKVLPKAQKLIVRNDDRKDVYMITNDMNGRIHVTKQ